MSRVTAHEVKQRYKTIFALTPDFGLQNIDYISDKVTINP